MESGREETALTLRVLSGNMLIHQHELINGILCESTTS